MDKKKKKEFQGVVKHLVVNSAVTEIKSQGRAERLRLPSKVICVINIVSVVRGWLRWPVIFFTLAKNKSGKLYDYFSPLPDSFATKGTGKLKQFPAEFIHNHVTGDSDADTESFKGGALTGDGARRARRSLPHVGRQTCDVRTLHMPRGASSN